MNYPKDLTGITFGKLKVLKKDLTVPKGARTRWICQCEYGNIKSIRRDNLISGQTISCGCAHFGATLQDLTGQKFGKLTVIKRGLDKISETGRKRVTWICQCECGNQSIVLADNLKSGKTVSCGCYNDEIRRNRFRDISQQKFGFLTAIEPTEKRNKSGEIVWKCLCDCGNFYDVSLGDLRSGDVIKCDKCQIASRGEEKISAILAAHNIEFKTEKSFPDLISPKGARLRFDFSIYQNGELICLIEYQGEQHYHSIDFFDKKESLDQRQLKDQIKRDYCQKKHIKLIEIPYSDFDILDWSYLYEKIWS